MGNQMGNNLEKCATEPVLDDVLQDDIKRIQSHRAEWTVFVDLLSGETLEVPTSSTATTEEFTNSVCRGWSPGSKQPELTLYLDGILLEPGSLGAQGVVDGSTLTAVIKTNRQIS